MRKIAQAAGLIAFVQIGVGIAAFIHEFGHWVFYRIQGIPAAISLVKEFPLRDLSVREYAVGSWGGIIFNWIWLIVLCAMIRISASGAGRLKKLIPNSLFWGQCIVLLLYALLLFKGQDKTEFIYAQGLFHLPKYSIVIFNLILTAAAIIFVMRWNRQKLKISTIVIALATGIVSVVFLSLLETYDAETNWRKYPTISVGDDMLYNEHRK